MAELTAGTGGRSQSGRRALNPFSRIKSRRSRTPRRDQISRLHRYVGLLCRCVGQVLVLYNGRPVDEFVLKFVNPMFI